MKTIYEQLNETIGILQARVVGNHDIHQELHGYLKNVPNYRTLTRTVEVEIERHDGKPLHICLLRPQCYSKSVEHENLTRMQINTGLLFLHEQLPTILTEDFNGVLNDHIKNIYELGPDVRILNVYLNTSTEQISTMLNKIKLMFSK